MDNRRVFSQSNSRRSSSSGLFSTVKRIFSRSGSVEPQADPAPPTTTEAQSSTRRYSASTSHIYPSKPQVETVPGTFDTTPRKRKHPEGSLPLPSSAKRAHRISSSTVLGTPRTTVLSRRPSQVSTPDYTPQYHNVSNTSMGSVRRVYQFSGLPSPYQTRIRPPKSSKVTKRPHDVSRGTLASANSTFDASMLSHSVLANKPSGPKSKTYKALESILDSQGSSDPLAQSSPMRLNNSATAPTAKSNGFGNPHAAHGGARRKISAADVAKSQPATQPSTMKTQPSTTQQQPTQPSPLPSTAQNESSKATSSSSSQFNFGPIQSVPLHSNASEANPKPASVASAPSFAAQKSNGSTAEKPAGLSFASSTASASAAPSKPAAPNFSFASSTTSSSNSTTQPKPATSLFGNTGKANEPVASVFPSTAKAASPKQSPPQPAFSMGAANGKPAAAAAPSAPQSATSAAGLTTSAATQFSFNIPKISAEIDENAVASAPQYGFPIKSSDTSI
ncbi:hypothetical protein DIURU_004227 [Diutina rugosa]|uniref:Uncharacterized protein n=1 Tax=Diutina rugosa TaxID=5481 RepID=A0A642UPZ1_DIURU|nr:uncharacterized protein DIURU_004227 [Diutina rugosa]KAA8899560.1 hypothetical protein DIURU_004227 [Diutina rugosa]